MAKEAQLEEHPEDAPRGIVHGCPGQASALQIREEPQDQGVARAGHFQVQAGRQRASAPVGGAPVRHHELEDRPSQTTFLS